MNGILRKIMILALSIPIAGCLVSGTKVFSVEVPTPITIPVGQAGQETVDLRGNSTFEKHGDKIRLIDRFGFDAEIDNEGNAATTIDIYFSREPVAEPEEDAYLLINDLAIGADETSISYAEAEAMIQNFEQLQGYVQDGVFTMYFISTSNSILTVEDLVVTVTFTVGL